MTTESQELQESEISLLDLLVVVAENIKLLLLGPLVVGLVALGVAYSLQQKYVSEAYLRLGASAKDVDAVLHSPLVLDGVYKKFYPQVPLTDAQRKIFGFSFKIVGSAKKDETLPSVLQVENDNPQRAQAVAEALIAAWLESTMPMPDTKNELERKLTQNKAALAEVSAIIDRMTTESAKVSVPTLQYDIATPMVQLLKIRNDHQDAITNIQLSLKGTSPDVVMSKPNLPSEPASNKKALIAILATLATGFVLLLWVFMRNAWSNAAQDPELAQKQSRLAAALGLRPKP